MKGRNICLQSRKHQKKHTRIYNFHKFPMFVGQTPKFPSDSIFGKKTSPVLTSNRGKTLLLARWWTSWTLEVGFFRFFPTIVSRRANEKSGVEAEMGHNKYGRMFKLCSPTIEWFKCWISMMFTNYWVFTNQFFFPGLDFTWNLKFPRLLGSILGLCDGLWHLCPLVQRLSKFLFRVGHVRMIFRAILDDFWEVTREHWWVDEIDMTWFWFLRDGKDDFAGKSEVYVVYAHGEIIIDFQRIFQTVGLEIFFRSIDDGFKFWTPKIISSRAQE